jgi:hypothetical protein
VRSRRELHFLTADSFDLNIKQDKKLFKSLQVESAFNNDDVSHSPAPLLHRPRPRSRDDSDPFWPLDKHSSCKTLNVTFPDHLVARFGVMGPTSETYIKQLIYELVALDPLCGCGRGEY